MNDIGVDSNLVIESTNELRTGALTFTNNCSWALSADDSYQIRYEKNLFRCVKEKPKLVINENTERCYIEVDSKYKELDLDSAISTLIAENIELRGRVEDMHRYLLAKEICITMQHYICKDLINELMRYI